MHRRWARLAKFITGWAAHLFYWVYPGVMVAFMAVLVTYIAGQFGINMPIVGRSLIAWLFAALVGFIAMRGISGSTKASIVINVIQLTALVVFSILAIMFRVQNPLQVAPSGWYQPTAHSIVIPHSWPALLLQSTIAILILVGFESSTALGAEAKNPKRDIPRGVLLSLVIQGVFAYLLEYFAANYALSDKLTSANGTLTGIQAAAASSAPIGDMAIQIGNAFLRWQRLRLHARHCLHRGDRHAGHDAGCDEHRRAHQLCHGPGFRDARHHGLAAWPICDALCRRWSSWSSSRPDRHRRRAGRCGALTGITLASNLGTFVLYALICGLTVVAFAGRHDFQRAQALPSSRCSACWPTS